MKKKTVIREIIEWAVYFASAFIFVVVFNNTIIVNAEVLSPSMEKTIMTDSRIIGSRISYFFHEPQRFDIVVFNFPDDKTSLPFVKRIIGLPNEKVEIKDGKVYINDSEIPLDDSFIKEEVKGDNGPFFVPEDSYFVMGDNRDASHDSRDWINKYVPKDEILGKILFEYYPSIKILR